MLQLQLQQPNILLSVSSGLTIDIPKRQPDLMWWADETVHYIDENGDRRFTDMMLNDPNGLNFYQTTSLHLGKGCIGIHDWHVMRTVYPQELLDVCLVWDSQGYDYVLPPITLTADEGERVVNNLNDINTLVEEYTVVHHRRRYTRSL